MLEPNKLALGALLAFGCLMLVDAARKVDSLTYDYLVFPTGCLDKFLGGNIFDEFCLKKTISKVLGYGIIAGACIVKVPQILRFVAAGSVKGISRESTYLELLGYLLGSIYHIVVGNPWSAYGETVIVTVQSLLIVVMLWAYDTPSPLHMLVVSGSIAALGQVAYTAPASWLPYVMRSTTLLFILSRGWQIAENVRSGSTGELAFLTLFMNFAGAAARIFTSLQEVKQVDVLVSFVISTALNALLLGQYVFYNFLAAPGKKGAKAPSKPQAPPSVASVTTPEQAESKEEEEEEAPTSGSASAGGSARRRRRIA